MGYGLMSPYYQVARVANGEVEELLSLTGAEFGEYKERKLQELMETDEY
jgi:hypothetical protein